MSGDDGNEVVFEPPQYAMKWQDYAAPVKLLHAVSTDKVRDSWPAILPGLQEVRDRCNEVWWPEDVYASLMSGHSFLYMIEDCGFVIFQKHADADGPVLFIWIIWGEFKAIHPAVSAEIEQLAVAMKAKRIRMHSPRKGWERFPFFKRKSVIYEREI